MNEDGVVAAPLPSVEMMGVRIHRVNRETLLAWLGDALVGEACRFVANVNAHAMNLAWVRPSFRQALNCADLVFVDGYGVVLAARLLRLEIGERLTFADWMPDFLRVCATRKAALFFLGDTDEVGAAFAAWVRAHYPGIVWAGHHHGFFARSGAENERVVAAINASGAQVLLVGMSMPIQEEWFVANRHRLPGVRVALMSGGYARIATGRIPRGPRWMTDHGLEWLYRFFQQPRYTWRRYWVGNPLFLMRAVAWRYFAVSPRD